MSLEAIPINKITFAYDSEEEAFPEVDPLTAPAGSNVLVQIRTPKKKTSGGIHLISDARDTEFWTTQIGKVRAIGPLAYHNRNTFQPWPEGAWCKVGDYVRVPKFGGDRWTVPIPGTDDEALMILFKDTDIGATIPGGWEDALKIKAFI